MSLDERAFTCPPHLPPHDAWKVDPDKLRKFYAPTDDRGFVLPDATVEIIKELFEDDYEWPVDFRYQQTQPDTHHFHWYKELYEPRYYQRRTIPRQFRNLPSVLGVMPRQFHNVIHEVTLPPQLPRYREMERHVQAYRVARRLFETATLAADLKYKIGLVASSDNEIDNGLLITRFTRQFTQYRMRVEEMMDIQGIETLRLDIPKFERRAPKEMAKVLGATATNRPRDFLPLFETRSIEAA